MTEHETYRIDKELVFSPVENTPEARRAAADAALRQHVYSSSEGKVFFEADRSRVQIGRWAGDVDSILRMWKAQWASDRFPD
jgi:hypothetical protein